MNVRLTGTGKLVAGVVVVAFVLGWTFGGRSLNVVVVPGAVALVASRLLVARYEEPHVTREAPRRGHRGETRRHRLSIEADPSYPIEVTEVMSEGLGGKRTWQAIADGREFVTELELTDRGRHVIGPTWITARDPLGLFEVEFSYSRTDDVIVYPRLRSLHGDTWIGEFLGRTDDRDRFDTVREYRPGDPLRDVNWKSSAKYQGRLMVTQFTGDRPVERVSIAAEATDADLEAVAEAAASLAVHLLELGLEVGIRTRTRHEQPARGTRQQRQVLGALAVMEAGQLPGEVLREADFVVSSDSGQATISLGTEQRSFAGLIEATPEVHAG